VERRTTARITAFSPGQSPPPVRTPIRTLRALDVRRLGADERPDVACGHEDAVDARTLELRDVVGGCIVEVGDGELSRGNVVQERQQHFQRILVRARLGGEQENLRIELGQHAFEVVGVGDAHDAFEAERARLLPGGGTGDDHGVCRLHARLSRAPEVEERKLRRCPDRVRVAPDAKTIRALTLGSGRAGGVAHLHEDGDAVALGDRLAQLAHRAHGNRRLPTATRIYRVRLMRTLVLLASVLILAGAAEAARIVGTTGNDRLIGTPRSDTILGREGRDRLVGNAGSDFLNGGLGSDVVDGGPGADRIVAQYDGARDIVRCGPGSDVVNADLVDRVAADCELVSRRLSRDPYTGPEAQHESQVEPDSLTIGSTTVATFQVGRRFSGAADNVGFAVSSDNGSTWRSGLLPGLTHASIPAGPNERASDPVVAYDGVNRVWLIATLALEGQTTRLTVSRSTDGVSWSAPVTAIEGSSPNGIAFDKNWIACDNGASSPHRGRCYLVYTDTLRDDRLAAITSSDGGATWSAPVGIPVTDAVGAFPVVRPSGELVVVYLWSGSRLGSSASTDGAASFGSPSLVAEVQVRSIRGLRFFPLPSADVDPSGRVWISWHDCRFSSGCAQNSVVVATSGDGRSWSTPTRVTTERNAFLPAIGIHPATGRVAIIYHVVRPGGIDVELVESRTGAPTVFATPRRLSAQTMRPEWSPNTVSGRMLADYISVHYAGDRPLAVWILASEPAGQSLRQAVYATQG